MQNGNYQEDPYASFDPQNTAGNGMMPYAGVRGNGPYGPANGYGGPQMAGQYYPQQGYQPMQNMNGPQMPQYNGYANQQQFTYGEAHMATYGNNNNGFNNGYGGSRRQSVSAGMHMSVPDIGLPPLAIKVFAERDEDGHPVPPMFLTAANHDAGIVNVQHNPFNIKTNEIIVALGQDCVVQDYPKSSGIFAIHIIQDRMTGKTNDIYVELRDWNEAEKVIRRYENQASRERGPKLGNRRAKMTLATASNLMKAVFPRAKCMWVNGKPERPTQWLNDNPCNWDGFITREEMVKVLMFAEQTSSAKTRFAQDSPERVYQMMITSMQKIPWDADRFFFPKDWVMELHATLSRMAVRLAQLVTERYHVNLDTKLLEQFMKVMHSSPMYGNGDPKAMENYMSIAAKVDEVVSAAPGVAAPPRRRGTMLSNNGGYRSESQARDESLREGLRGMHLEDRQDHDHSPVRREREQSPVRRGYSSERRNQSPVRRDQSPVRRDQSPVRREQSLVTRDHSPVRRSRNESPVRREQSMVTRDQSPVRRSRNESPVRRQQSPLRRDYSDFAPTAPRTESPVRRQRHESPVREYSSARREYSPVRREYSPVRREQSPVRVLVRDVSPVRRSDQYASEYSSRASHRATTSGSPMNSSSSGRRSTIQFSGSSTGRPGRRYDD